MPDPRSSKPKVAATGKKRVRKHVIADMSFHHLAMIVVECGYTIQAVSADYGYDASVITYDDDGLVENSPFWIQLKATDKLDRERRTGRIRFALGKRDMKLWSGNPFPVYLIVYDAKERQAYWLHLQRYFFEHAIAADTMKAKSLRVFIDPASTVDLATVRTWRDDKNAQLAKMSEVGHA